MVLGRDVVVPADVVEHVAEDGLHLRVDKKQLERYPDYVAIKYESPPEDWIPPPDFAYPGMSPLWPAAYPFGPSSVKVNAPPGSVGLYHGMDVQSSDGHKVGSIDALDEDPATGDVTGIVVKSGFLLTHDTLIDASHIKRIDDGAVVLDIPKDDPLFRETE
jgi:sporulation protein YlmC with PRC-barrel domain